MVTCSLYRYIENHTIKRYRYCKNRDWTILLKFLQRRGVPAFDGFRFSMYTIVLLVLNYRLMVFPGGWKSLISFTLLLTNSISPFVACLAVAIILITGFRSTPVE